MTKFYMLRTHRHWPRNTHTIGLLARQSIEVMLGGDISVQTPHNSYEPSTDVWCPMFPILNVLQRVYQGKKQPFFCMPLTSCLSILVAIDFLRDKLTLASKTLSSPIMLRDPRDRSKLLFFEKMFPSRIRSEIRQTTSKCQFLRLCVLAPCKHYQPWRPRICGRQVKLASMRRIQLCGYKSRKQFSTVSFWSCGKGEAIPPKFQ